MAKIRHIKVEFWTSPQIVECSPLARLFFIGLWNFCDDGGIHPYSLKRLKMEIFPADENIFSRDIEQLLIELQKNMLIKFYTIADEKYIKVTGWHHQTNYEKFFKYPDENGIVPKNETRKNERQKSKSKKSRSGKRAKGTSMLPECDHSVTSVLPECQQSSNKHRDRDRDRDKMKRNRERESTNPHPEILFKILTAENKYFNLDRGAVDAYVDRFPNLNVAQSLAKIEGRYEAMPVERRWRFVNVLEKINNWLADDARQEVV
jgi:hypothetical protein